MARASRSMAADEPNRGVPFAQFEYVTVVFPATPDVDVDVPHRLRPPLPEDVNYLVVRQGYPATPGTSPVVYHDVSATRIPWPDGHVYLRCNAPNVVARVLLTVEA